MKIIKSLHGIGDHVYERPLIKALAEREELYIESPLPFMLSGIENVKFLRTETPWRTQQKQRLIEENFISIEYSQLPEEAFQQITYPPIRPGYPRPNFNRIQRVVRPELEIRFGYGPDNYSRWNLIQCLERQAKVTLSEPIDFAMPDFGPCPVDTGGKKLAIVRPPTDRAEWHTPSRQCLPQYTNRACQMLKAAGYYTVSVADCVQGKEWLVGDAPEADLILHSGELSLVKLMALCQHADVIVGGVCWIVPAGIAFKRNTFIIAGGRLGYDSQFKITDMRMDLEKFTMVHPDPMCQCFEAKHNCYKTISNFDEEFQKFINNAR